MENYRTTYTKEFDVLGGVLREVSVPVYRFALREDLKNNKEFMPTRGEPKATGWDVRAAQSDKEPIAFHPFMKYLIPLGFRALCPEGWWFELKPRSSTFGKKALHSLYGTIDETYEGELLFACQFIPSDSLTDHANPLIINFGDAIGQIIPVRRQEMIVEEASNEEYDNFCKERNAQRGAGGFGSTTK